MSNEALLAMGRAQRLIVPLASSGSSGDGGAR